MMDRLQLIQRTRALTRDLTNTVFREVDIINFINEGVDRFKQVIPELRDTQHLIANHEVPVLIPPAYRHLLALYAASRCFGQDEQFHAESTKMNEFEVKLDKLKADIEGGLITIYDADGEPVIFEMPDDGVRDVYFHTKNYRNNGVLTFEED